MILTWSSRALPIYASALGYIMDAQCCTHAIDNICETGIFFDRVNLYYHSASSPRGVLSFAYNIYHVVGWGSQCVAISQTKRVIVS